MPKHPPFVTTYNPICGWKAVFMAWDTECGMYVPWDTSYMAYPTEASAIREARAWADAEGIDYKSRGEM